MPLKWHSRLFWENSGLAQNGLQPGTQHVPKMDLLKDISKLNHQIYLIFCLKLEVNDTIKMAWQAIFSNFRFSPKCAMPSAQPAPKVDLFKDISKLDLQFSLLFCQKLEVNDAFKMAQRVILATFGFSPKWAIARYSTCAQNGPFERYLEIGSLVFFCSLSEVRGQ